MECQKYSNSLVFFGWKGNNQSLCLGTKNFRNVHNELHKIFLEMGFLSTYLITKTAQYQAGILFLKIVKNKMHEFFILLKF